MNERHLHIVTHDIPYPADYGGVVDLFNKLKPLQQLGIHIHLHCFTHGRKPQPILEQFCASVHYYPRKKNISRWSFRLPFIVNSRRCSELIDRLNRDQHPILLEGIQTSYGLFSGELSNRKIVVRLHNAEFEYYRQLAKLERNPVKKLYYWHESRLLKQYEKELAQKALFLAVSTTDMAIYRNEFSAPKIDFMPVFLPHTLAAGKPGKGCFCLYHGNLGINENERAVSWLMQSVFPDLNIPLVIAGKNPPKKLQEMVHRNLNCCIVANPTDEEMQDMIKKAQINILPSFNNTGVKIKLFNALFNGRYCIANPAAVSGAETGSCCVIATTANEFQEKIKALYDQPYTEDENERRQGLLQHTYHNATNAQKLVSYLFD